MLAVVLCTTAFAVPASAGGGDGEPYYTETTEPETTEPAEETEPTEETTGGMEPEGQPLTPEGNATLVYDFYGDKHSSRSPPRRATILYSDRPGKRGTRRPPFTYLNQVDEADLWP